MRRMIILSWCIIALSYWRRRFVHQDAYALSCNPWEYYNPEWDICEDCIPWYYCPGDNELRACPWWTHSSDINATSCVPCWPGTYSSAGSASCVSCPQGSYQPGWWAASCLLCDPGSYANTLGSTQCYACPANTFSRYAWAPLCAPCRDGTMSVAGATTCYAVGWWVDAYSFVKVPIGVTAVSGSSTWLSSVWSYNLKTAVKKKIKRVIRLWRK